MRRNGWAGKILVIVIVLFLLFCIGAVFSDHEPDLLEGQARTYPWAQPENTEEGTDNPGEPTEEHSAETAEPAEREEPAESPQPQDEEENPAPGESYFEVHYLDVGQADAALVLCDGHAMLIDGGNVSDSRKMYAYLAEHEIGHLDCVVCTHPHDDHAGGLAGALNYASVDAALCSVSEYDSAAFANFTKYLAEQGVSITVPTPGDTFRLGSAEGEILGPVGEAAILNDMSIVLRITYGDTSFLFTGDAEREEEQSILDAGFDLRSTVLKVGHHGGSSSTTYPFLREVMPEYAVISVGENNTYGHPSEGALSRLRDAGVELYRTDLQGTIVCRSDGESVRFMTEKDTEEDLFRHRERTVIPVPAVPEETLENTEDETVEDPESRTAPDAETPVEPRTYTYILNTNTHKFHNPNCPSIGQMSEKNKEVYVGNRDEIIEMGYEPCERCYP
ncbi:MAG: MBL fold metallo-hydrolase [Oscillospiraceae bacterium]|nr:MBL fold metallo-hydrolase [Oscillospiraceae bacterium]